MATCIYPAFTKKPGPRKGYKRIAPTSDKSNDPLPPQETQTLGSALDDNGEWDESWSQNALGQMSWSQSSFSGDTFHPLSSLDPTLEVTALATTLESVPSQPPWSNSPIKDSPLPSKALIVHLLDVYFDYVHPQIRLLHQPSFVSRVESGSYALDEQATLILSSIFALAARYSDHPEVDLFDRMLLRRASGSYDSQDDIRYKSRKRWERGQGFLSQAYRLLMNETSRMDRLELESGEMQRPSITVVQAAAIVTFAQMGIGLSGRTYSLLSTTVRLAHDCGLDQVDYNDETISMSRDSDSEPCKSTWVKKEELRRTWWVIAYLENFICVTKDRPRMIDWGKCKTKLPCDDKVWFQGRYCPSDFLPASLDDLRASLTVQPQLSVLAYRIRTMHLGAKMLEEAMNHDDALESNEILTKIQDVFAISSKIRCFKHATPSDIFNLCHDLSRRRRQGNDNGTSPETKAFSRALSASETVCSILRDSSADDVPRSCPYPASVLWVPACLQLLVKLFTRADPELAERASLSLQILTMTLERFAEFSGLGRFVLNSFRRYEKKLTDLQWADSKPGDDDHWILSRILFFPDHINALSLKEVTSIDHSEGLVDPALALYQEPSAQFSIGRDVIVQDGIDSFDYITKDSNWIWSEGVNGF
ncbi:fungal specific transcription factor domain-containing protein [Trichoderma breve]|uniref:Fungal specific transcription factor domain-containing protein n=1 Tax=Trichoderma breve TaxID=2034170 RepID=A0A9W9EEH4_9HYPO|nr:fungal specific transcription factor domain-containing protein [Trichoderma breve]KAJ4865101.1 fungal specific transcription factor domain-containing protein [Trichoderma breve]